MLATINTHDNPITKDKQKNLLSPKDKSMLKKKKKTGRYHTDKDWSFFAQDTPNSLKNTSPIRPSLKFNPRIPKISSKQDKKR